MFLFMSVLNWIHNKRELMDLMLNLPFFSNSSFKLPLKKLSYEY